MIYDNIFFINSALNAPEHLSVFSEQERFDHTLETLESIDKWAPNSKKYIFDCSITFPKWQANQLKDVTFTYIGNNPGVQRRSVLGQRSIAETIAFLSFLEWFQSEQLRDVKAKRIVKLSGRYSLNENFPKYTDEMADSFVFVKPEDSWMPKDKQKNVGVYMLYKLRQWQMGFEMLPAFNRKLIEILKDCIRLEIDIEHSYYKHLHTEKIIEVDKIGVHGFIAPSGEFIEE